MVVVMGFWSLLVFWLLVCGWWVQFVLDESIMIDVELLGGDFLNRLARASRVRLCALVRIRLETRLYLYACCIQKLLEVFSFFYGTSERTSL